MASLKILTGDHAGRVVTLQGDSMTIGRHPQCDVVLSDETISRQHARIVRRLDGYYVEDLGSRNGTSVNGQRLESPARLGHRDQIQLFQTSISFVEESAAATRDQSISRTMHAVSAKRSDANVKALFETIAEIDVTMPGQAARAATDLKLQAVLEITRYLRSSLEPDVILTRIVECVAHVFPNSSQSYVLRSDEATGQLRPVARQRQGDRAAGPDTLSPVTRALARRVLTEGKAVLSVGVPDEAAVGAPASVLAAEHASFMCAPLVGPSGRSRGVLYVETNDEARRFDQDDLEVFACIAILAGQAIERDAGFGFTGIVHEISARHRAERALRRENESLEHTVKDRSESISLLQDVAVIANEAESVEQALRAVLRRVCRFSGWPAAHVLMRSSGDPSVFADANLWFVEGEAKYRRLVAATRDGRVPAGHGDVSRVIATGKPEWTGNLASGAACVPGADAAACGLNSAVACPVLVGEEVAAVVEFLSTDAAPPDETVLELMTHVGTQLGRVIERDRLQRQMVDAVWDQHRRFGQELHDTLGQALTGIAMLADSLSRKLQAQSLPEAGNLAELTEMIQQAKTDVRRLSKGLYPVDVDAQGILSALEELAAATQQRCGIRCVFKGDREVQLPDNEVATHLFRIAQEALHNAVKHGQPQRISVSLTQPQGRVTLAIRDNGTGVTAPPAGRSAGLGLRIMQYRAHAMGAKLSIEAPRQGGTLVRCTLKREVRHAAARQS